MYKKTEVLENIHQRALDYIGDKKSKESYINYREEFQNAARKNSSVDFSLQFII